MPACACDMPSARSGPGSSNMASPATATASPLTPYELQREERIRRNEAIMEALGIPNVVKQLVLHQSGMRVVKSATRCKEKTRSGIQRCSPRLAGTRPAYAGIEGDEPVYLTAKRPGYAGSTGMSAEEVAKRENHDKKWLEFVKLRRCDSPSRGSIYDSSAGITCHFCRQKKLCGEGNCGRCSTRDPSVDCIGKSECTRCNSASGRFCRACLLVRYGLVLEDVRNKMAAGSWLCPHCYADDHPDEGWICNSSICMKRQGLQPTGIAIYDAQKKGYKSVAHYVQAKLRARKSSGLLPSSKSPSA